MTRYFLNEREIAPPGDMSSFDQILKHVEKSHLPPDSVIRQIQVDGHPLVPESFVDPGEILRQMESRDRIEIFTATVLEVARDSVFEAIDYLERVETVTHSLASSFQISPGPESFQTLRQLLDGFYWLSLLLDKLAVNFKIALESCSVQGASAREHLGKFVGVLKQLIDAQERGDSTLISDLLEYEVIPTVPVWKDMFGLVLREMDKEKQDSRKPVK